MRRCPGCTTLVDEGQACPACGRPAQAARPPPSAPVEASPLLRRRVTGEDVAGPTKLAARRGRHGPPAKRPVGVAVLGWVGVVLGALTALDAAWTLVRIVQSRRALEELGFGEAVGYLMSAALLVFFVGTTMVVVNLALLRGLRLAWWVTVAFDALMGGNALLVAVASVGLLQLFPEALLRLGVAVVVMGLFYAALFGTMLAYLCLPTSRGYFFEPPSPLAPRPRAARA